MGGAIAMKYYENRIALCLKLFWQIGKINSPVGFVWYRGCSLEPDMKECVLFEGIICTGRESDRPALRYGSPWGDLAEEDLRSWVFLANRVDQRRIDGECSSLVPVVYHGYTHIYRLVIIFYIEVAD